MTSCDMSHEPGECVRSDAFGASAQPNELDLRRIVRALENRARYRYVTPDVRPVANGYLITSPCCSRNVDPGGGPIAIALIVFDPARSSWLIHSRDHQSDEWHAFARAPRLSDILDCLNEDPERVFWQ